MQVPPHVSWWISSTVFAYPITDASTEKSMKKFVLTPPLFGFVVATRAALGLGIGLLVADKIPAARRRAIGAALVAIGAITTVPAAISVLGSSTPMESDTGLLAKATQQS
jgi:hypothetical protein